jgi:hypothetical protein
MRYLTTEPKTGFSFFRTELIEKFKAENRNYNMVKQNRIIFTEWKKLDRKKRYYYQRLGKREKERHKKALERIA